MFSKEENARMDEELMNIVNSGRPADKSKVITPSQISSFIENENKKKVYRLNNTSENETKSLSLQEKSVSGTIKEKTNNLAKIIFIAGIAVAIVGSFAYCVSHINIKSDATDKDDVSNVEVSQVSYVDDSSNSIDDEAFLGKDETANLGEETLVDIRVDESSVGENSSDKLESNIDENSNDESVDNESSSDKDDENNVDKDIDNQSSINIEESNLNSNIDEDRQVVENTEKNDSAESDVVFEVGTSSDIDETEYYLNNTIEGYCIRVYSEMYGLDPKIIAAICYQESGGVNIVDGGAAIGVMMLEDMADYDITVYNYIDGCYETLTVSSSRADDMEYNIRCGIANMQNKLNYFDGNMYAALQAYNYSEYTLQNALDLNGYTLNGINDYNWLYITEDVTNNPQKYGISAKDENGEEIYPKYGVSYYPCYTGYHLIDEVINYNYISNGEIHEVEFNFATASVIKDNVIDHISEKSL